MPQRIALSAIGVTRNGKTVYPVVGKPFDFTAEELATITNLEKSSGNKLVRKLINENGDAPQANTESEETAKANYAAKTVPELKALAEERGVDLGDSTKKDDIIAKLEAADAAAEDEDL